MHSCCFIGHKDCLAEISHQLKPIIEMLITNQNITTFYVGTQGNFDKIVYETLCSLKEIYQINVFVVLAYLDSPKSDCYYNQSETIFPDILTTTPLRFAIRKRNSYMIQKSDYVIAYLNSPFSNTISNLEEAVKRKKKIINLGTYPIQNISL